MIVCICCNLNTEKVKNAIENSNVTEPENVHEYYNTSPRCCGCFLEIEEMMEHKNNNGQDQV